MEIINSIVAYLESSFALLVLLAAIFEWFIPYPYFLRFNRLLPSLATLGRRVNRYGHSKAQQSLAGVLLPLLIVASILVIVFLCYYLSNTPKFTSFILLLLVLESRPPRSAYRAITRYISSNQPNEAKNILARFTLRRTDKLSKMGLLKASAEMVNLRLFYNFYVPLMLCLIFGHVLPAVIYRVLLLCRMAFNLKHPFNQSFGSFSASLTSVFEIIPTAIILLIGWLIPHRYPIQQALTQALNSWPSKTGGLFLAETAAATNLKLGGPRYYLITLFRFPTIGGTIEPEPNVVKLFIFRTISVAWFTIAITALLIILISHI